MAADQQSHGFKKLPQFFQSGSAAAIASGRGVRAQDAQRLAARQHRNADKAQ